MAPPRDVHLALPSDAGPAAAAAEPDVEEPDAASPVAAIDPSCELGAVAFETSIYSEPSWGARRIGYLRAGSLVHRSAEPVAVTRRCPGGWFRVEPRGFVCAGPMATLDAHHPVIGATAYTPKPDGLPYLYVMGRGSPPPLYARLPSRAEQHRCEPKLGEHLAKNLLPAGLPPPDPIPDWLAPVVGRRTAPSLGLGNEWRGPDRVRLGRVHGRSGFALLKTVEHEGRRFGVTTALEIIPLDRTRLVPQSRFSGVELRDGMTLPVAFVRRRGAFRVRQQGGTLMPGDALPFRSAVAVTGEVRRTNSTTYLLASDGSLVRESDTVVVKGLKHLPTWARDGAKWIDVSIFRQSLTAYEGTTPVYVTLVSTGVGGTGDPEETHATAQGIFKVYEKHLSVTMDGHESSDAFDLRDVPFVQYFHKGYALHGAYWHDDFGRTHSHGCINLSPADAAWLFRWTDPRIPAGWHAVMALDGTILYVH